MQEGAEEQLLPVHPCFKVGSAFTAQAPTGKAETPHKHSQVQGITDRPTPRCLGMPPADMRVSHLSLITFSPVVTLHME